MPQILNYCRNFLIENSHLLVLEVNKIFNLIKHPKSIKNLIFVYILGIFKLNPLLNKAKLYNELNRFLYFKFMFEKNIYDYKLN